jgi:hypothetical protein
VQRLTQIEAADAADEQISDSSIKEPPCDIDRRGGQAYAGGRCEWALEGMSRDSVAEMRQSIREKYATDEVRYVVIPAHVFSLPVYKTKVRASLKIASSERYGTTYRKLALRNF